MPAIDTAPPPSLTCPAWCTDHQRTEHPDDEAHWAEPKLPVLDALGAQPRLSICQYVRDTEPVFMLELTVSPDDHQYGPEKAAEYFQALSDALAALAASTASLVPGREA